MAKYTPLLMMRTRGLSGPMFANHKGVSGLSKSVGNFLSSDNPLVPIGPNLYPNYLMEGGSDIVQDVPVSTLPTGHTLVFNTSFPCDANYDTEDSVAYYYDFNPLQLADVRLLLQQTIGTNDLFEVGKLYRFQANIKTVTDTPVGGQPRALHIAATDELNLVDTDNSYISENSNGFELRWIDFEVTSGTGRGNFRHGAGVFNAINTQQITQDLAIYELAPPGSEVTFRGGTITYEGDSVTYNPS